MTYYATARYWHPYWELYIHVLCPLEEGDRHRKITIGVTQVLDLLWAERVVRDYLQADNRPDAQTAEIVIALDTGGLAHRDDASRPADR